MTEEEWLEESEGCDPRGMIWALEEDFPPRTLKSTKAGRTRKLRLFGCAACRRLWHLFVNSETQALIETVARHANEQATGRELAAALRATRRAKLPEPKPGDEYSPLYGAYDYAVRAADNLGSSDYPAHAAQFVEDLYSATVNDPDNPEEEDVYQAALLRDIFGNPFRPVTFTPEWRTNTTVALAQQMYESHDFSAMPILADALQDAGCASEGVLAHCRNPQQAHVRGCWVVDLVLGKA